MAPSKRTVAKENVSKTIVLKKVKKKMSYRCPDCNKTFTENSAFHLHTKLHAEVYPYSCDRCSYKCKIKKYLSRHVKKVHNKANGPECPVCGKVFHFDSNLKIHMRVHTGEKPYKCSVCKKAFSSSYCLSMHNLIHTEEKPYHCKFCAYACRDSSTLRRHQERHMGILKEYPCNKCKKVLKSATSLKIHVDEVHYGLDTRKFPCEQCDKAFKTKTALTTHVKTVHDKASRIDCEICGRSITKNNVIAHLQSHVDIKPYKCSYKTCPRAFKDRGSLRKHILIHYPECQFQCDLCECKFARKCRLREHKMKHVTEGGFTCEFCGVSFVKKTYITVHIRLKHGPNCEKFICDKCGLTTYTKKCITLHLRYGHGSAQDRRCSICSEVVTTSHQLKEHYFMSHQTKFVVQESRAISPVPRAPTPPVQKDTGITIKDEPMEVCAEFTFNYDVQKIEMDDHVSDREYEDSVTTIAYSTQVLEEDMARDLTDSQDAMPQNEFDRFFSKQLMHQPTRQTNIPEPEYVDTETTLAYSKKVLEEDINRSLLEREKKEVPENSFDEFFLQQVMRKPKPKALPKKKIKKADKRKLASVKKSIEKMLTESRNRKEADSLEKMRRTYNMRIKMAHKSERKKEATKITYLKKSINVQETINSLRDTIISNNDDETDNDVPQNDDQDTIQNDINNDSLQDDQPLNESQNNKAVNDESQNQSSDNDTLQNGKPDDDGLAHDESDDVILHYGEPDSDIIRNNTCDNVVSQNENTDSDTLQNDIPDNVQLHNDNADSDTLQNGKPDNFVSQNDKPANNELQNSKSDINIPQNDNPDSDTLQNDQTVNDTSQNHKPNNESENTQLTSQNVTITEVVQEEDQIDDDDHGKRITRNRNKLRRSKIVTYDDKDSDYVCSGTENANKNGKITFDGHECYICFKLFKTKADFKIHCREHFDICNEKMLKKCPFCGYVTNLNIKRHVELVHKINIKYAYGHITERDNCNGSKYVFELNNDRELEVIPSISNLNKIACMKNDKKIRQNKNMFIGTTKLVKKGGEWVVEKHAVDLNNQYLLPEFTDEEYNNLNIQGDGYLDGMKKLSVLARKRGVKMLYPCGGCEKICQTLAALKLHNRKHEMNPKRFKPKVWINRHIEYKTKNRKNKNKKDFKRPVRQVPVKNTGKSTASENRFASPQPVKNKHKCDKKLIDFYKSNIKGGDIQFWQFLKIFNKMSRENVNDFEDLENRNDLHFGLHYKPVITVTEPTATEVTKEPVHTESEPVHTESEPVQKNIGKNRKSVSKKFTRAIMISKKDYMRRKEIKNQMRKRLEETRV